MDSGDTHGAGPRSRRRFLAGVITTIQAAIGTTLGMILGGALFSPSFMRRRETWLSAGTLSVLAVNEPTPATVRVARDDGYAQVVDRQVVFLVRSGDSAVVALSSVCTHLGCRVSWDAEKRVLRCPCHGGVFDPTGAVRGGPPPAPLAALPTRIDGDQVFVQI